MERHPCESLMKKAGGMQVEREIVSALFAAEGYSLSGRRHNRIVLESGGSYVLISGTTREKESSCRICPAEKKEDISPSAHQSDP